MKRIILLLGILLSTTSLYAFDWPGSDGFTNPETISYLDCDTMNIYSMEYQEYCDPSLLDPNLSDTSTVATTITIEDRFDHNGNEVVVKASFEIEVATNFVSVTGQTINLEVICVNCVGDTAYLRYIAEMSTLQFLNHRLGDFKDKLSKGINNFWNGSLTTKQYQSMLQSLKGLVLKNGKITIVDENGRAIAVVRFLINHIDFDYYETEVQELVQIVQQETTNTLLDGIEVYDVLDADGNPIQPSTTLLDMLPDNIVYQCKTIHGVIEGIRYTQTACGFWPI